MRCGAFGYLPTVAECRTSPQLGRVAGVEEPSAIAVQGKEGEVWIKTPYKELRIGSMVYEFYHHPQLLIPPSIRAWWREYKYSGASYGAVPFLDRHPCGIEAVEVFESICDILRGQNAKQND